MIRELGNNMLSMYQGDTGTISFKITGDCEEGDTYVFSIKKTLQDAYPVFTQTFDSEEFTAFIDEETAKRLPAGDYFWGIKLIRKDAEENSINTLIGRGILKIERGV
jgi:hypothetical protein